MNISISDLAINIEDKIQGYDWIEACILCLSVFLGALFAYKFNLKHDKKKDRQIILNNYCVLATNISMLLNDLLDYKSNHLDKIKLAFENGDTINALQIINMPNTYFQLNVEKHFFLTGCNRCFLTELKNIQQTNEHIQSILKDYCNYVFDLKTKPMTPEQFSATYSNIKSLYLNLYKVYETFCLKVYYMNKQFSKCYERYFNVHYFDDIEESFQKEVNIEQYIPQALSNQDCIKWEQYFDKYWFNHPSLWCGFCFQKRKWKHRFKFLIKFIAKPKECKMCYKYSQKAKTK